ncbi:uncharacterized protein LOC135468745 isoform X2 [Liolophura sinensis]|uniref:uncharacterized protein LOC135468745 isoform X2 n=1 Tax=Liolophura sinensis TaxID=3198878 RepID=UPI003158D34F
MSDPNPNVKNWRDCLDPKLPVFQKTKSDTAPQNPSGGNFYDEGTSGSQKEIWDDVEDFPELKVCGYNPKRELDYGTSTDKAEKSEAGTCNQVTNIPGLTGAMLDGMRRQVKRNTTAPGGGSANSQTISTTDWCSTSKKPPANQDSACEKSVQYKSTAADDTNPLMCGSSTRDVGGLSSADGLTNIGLDEHPHPEDNEEEWTQVGKKKRKDTSSTAVPKSKKKGKVGVAASRPYIPGMNYAPRPAQQNKASNFERLLSILQQRFPQLNRPELIEVIQQVRSKKGSLTGLSMEQIVEECRPYSERKINMKSKVGRSVSNQWVIIGFPPDSA